MFQWRGQDAEGGSPSPRAILQKVANWSSNWWFGRGLAQRLRMQASLRGADVESRGHAVYVKSIFEVTVRIFCMSWRSEGSTPLLLTQSQTHRHCRRLSALGQEANWGIFAHLIYSGEWGARAFHNHMPGAELGCICIISRILLFPIRQSTALPSPSHSFRLRSLTTSLGKGFFFFSFLLQFPGTIIISRAHHQV